MCKPIIMCPVCGDAYFEGDKAHHDGLQYHQLFALEAKLSRMRHAMREEFGPLKYAFAMLCVQLLASAFGAMGRLRARVGGQ
jgi:hypothetical protein